MKVRKEATKLSKNALNSLNRIDFHDTFSTTNHIDSIEEITKKIFEYSPLWMEYLFLARKLLAKILGIETIKVKGNDIPLSVGSRIGNFKVYNITQNEIIIGRDDPHLKFRAIISNHSELLQYNIQVSTLVLYNNMKGRIYMLLIAYLHRIVAKSMVKNAYHI